MAKKSFRKKLVILLLPLTLMACGSASKVIPIDVTSQALNEAFTAAVEPTTESTIMSTCEESNNLTPMATALPATPTTPPIIEVDSIQFPQEALMLMDDIGTHLYLYDLKSNEPIRELTEKEYLLGFDGWYDSGCSLFVTNADADIARVDLNGKWLQTLFSYKNLDQKEENLIGYRAYISPDYRWVWYYVGGGNYANEVGPQVLYETMNIRVVSVDGTIGPFEISQNGGAWIDAKWSPDGSLIAYSDLDDQHAQQLFVATRGGENRVQLTHFEETVLFEDVSENNLKLHGFEWSPDGENIAVNYSKDWDRLVDIISLDGKKFSVEGLGPKTRALWWVDVNRLILSSQTPGREGLYVYNIQSKAVEGEVLETHFPFIEFAKPFISTDVIGFFSFDTSSNWEVFYLYDIETKRFEKLLNIERIDALEDWWMTPNDFPGEVVCQNK